MSIPFVSAKSDKYLFKIFLKYAHVSYFHHFTNWNLQFWVLMSLSTMISKINTLSPCDPSLRQLHKKWDTPDFHRGLSCALLQLRLILSCGWPDFRGLNTSCDWLFLRATRVSAAAYDLRLSGVPTVGFKLRMSQVPATGYKLRLTPSYGWLKFGQLETSCGRWIQVVADFILWLALVPAAE